MKTRNANILNLFLILGFLLISVDGNSQDNKLSRQERKEVRKAQLNANFNILDSLLSSQSFVLEADYLQNRYGERVFVTPTLNFIKVDKERGILQTGSIFSMGYNGVGGVTAQGRIGSWKVDKDAKKQSYRVRFSILTNIGNYDIFMVVTADNYAMATISGLGPGELTWKGHLVTVGNSRIFKGEDSI